jgi:hypothetical protein
MAAFNSVYNLTTGPLPKLNGVVLTLVPKTEIADTPGIFRPISPVHSFAKIMSKVLALRLVPQINGLVSQAQSAFIKRHWIQENFLYVCHLARAYHRKKTPALLMKLDITKAFDSVSWEYLLELLECRGFPSKWQNWFALLLSSSNSVIRLNRIQGHQIQHQQGLRQGTPLSPLLFVIAIDTLQYVLQKETQDGLLSPLRDRTARLRLSLYADDAAMFIRPSREEVDNVVEILRSFGDATGLRVTIAKSSVIPIRCTEINLDEV